MRFDERARRAAQGIHRAVEVMEMSSTKTPHKITRFDQYRARTSRNQRIVAIAVGVGVPLLLLVGAVRFLGSDPDPKVPLAPPSMSVSPTPVSGRSRRCSRRRSRTRCPPAGRSRKAPGGSSWTRPKRRRGGTTSTSSAASCRQGLTVPIGRSRVSAGRATR